MRQKDINQYDDGHARHDSYHKSATDSNSNNIFITEKPGEHEDHDDHDDHELPEDEKQDEPDHPNADEGNFEF